MSSASKPVWIVGATGRIGRVVAAELCQRGLVPVLVGRDERALQALAATLTGAADILVTKELTDVAQALSGQGPVVVLNLLGPFTESARSIIDACAPGSDYLDAANDLASASALRSKQEQALAEDRCLVTGAGFGVLGCESLAFKLCAGLPAPVSIRVDAVPYINTPGPTGTVVAATLVEALEARGQIFKAGKWAPAAVGSHAQLLTLPDGVQVRTGALPSGDLLAVQRITQAHNVIVASNLVPTSPVARLLLPLLAVLASVPVIRRFLIRQLAKIDGSAVKPVSSHTWVHARATWADGSVREGYLRAGEGMLFTARVASEVAFRLAHQQGKAGVFTPGELFGADLAQVAGAEFMLKPALCSQS